MTDNKNYKKIEQIINTFNLSDNEAYSKKVDYNFSSLDSAFNYEDITFKDSEENSSADKVLWCFPYI